MPVLVVKYLPMLVYLLKCNLLEMRTSSPKSTKKRLVVEALGDANNNLIWQIIKQPDRFIR